MVEINKFSRPQKKLTPDAARDIWRAVLAVESGTPECSKTSRTEDRLISVLEKLHPLVNGTVDDPLGFFLSERRGQGLQKADQVDAVQSSPLCHISCNSITANIHKVFNGRV